MYLITGGAGQLGQCFKSILGSEKAYFPDIDELDMTSKESIASFLKEKNIQAIINCAAYTQVDLAENDIEKAVSINVDGAQNLAETGLPLIHISTDYVFDGLSNRPYTEEDAPNPLSVYGKTKEDGEKAILNTAEKAIIIRTSWLYSEYGNNFLKTMLRLFKEKDSINIVWDQVGTPTYARHLAQSTVYILSVLDNSKSGIYHFSNEGVASWYDFACEIKDTSQHKCYVGPLLSKDYPTQAERPMYSVLNKEKIKQTFGIDIPHWKIGVKECIKNLS